MKIISILFISLCVSLSALATPAVGDQAVYSGTVTTKNKTMAYELEQSILSQDTTTGKFKMQTKASYNGKSLKKAYPVDQQNLLSDSAINQQMTDCTKNLGTLETITVPAGTFNTCKMKGQGGHVWIASGIPFGIVKTDGKNFTGQKIFLELQSYINGN